ncbi:hypothetical protein BJ508DRAFT_73266 [Ascobolus immersus RN42]|uniref:Uncharacterized protein n=1 Tax=Ascobolus immersus RN42 TaxID=1160509 RepID=A0A3N4HS38_ASCIM|nr:hypothetical protein BJ508DRAFT_73266 [Ascobolus immersus RN42]
MEGSAFPCGYSGRRSDYHRTCLVLFVALTDFLSAFDGKLLDEPQLRRMRMRGGGWVRDRDGRTSLHFFISTSRQFLSLQPSYRSIATERSSSH